MAAVLATGYAAGIPAADVLLKVELQNYGQTSGLTPAELPGASGGYAMALGNESTGAAGGVKLEPGQYTLLLRAWAPAGDQDGFFVEIAGKRERRVAPGQKWTAMAYNFGVEKAGVVTIAIIGQERGLAVDQIAVVKGTYETGQVRMVDLPGETIAQGQAGLADLPRMKSQCSLEALPDAPPGRDVNTVLYESFDGAVAGAVGDHSQVEGKFGRALYLAMPDGRFDVDASDLDLGAAATIEYWVRPRPGQRLWHDQGWHYFLHCKPVGERGFQLDLSRHSRTNLRLTASMGGKPMDKDLDPREDLQVSTGDLDLEAWHHMLVSWDLSGDRQYLWLMVDGRGVQLFFDRRFDASAKFSKIEIGNTPSGWDVPYLHIDGAIDELKISNVSVADRLAR
jgi:hypothetical protein